MADVFPKVPSRDHLRLHLGELTADEARIAQAAYRLALIETRRAHEPATNQPETFHRECCAVCGEQFTTSGHDDLCPLCQADDDLHSGDAVDAARWRFVTEGPMVDGVPHVCVHRINSRDRWITEWLSAEKAIKLVDAAMLANGARPGEE